MKLKTLEKENNKIKFEKLSKKWNLKQLARKSKKTNLNQIFQILTVKEETSLLENLLQPSFYNYSKAIALVKI